MKGLSLFANVGIAETYLAELGVDIVIANELLTKRALFYAYSHKCEVILGKEDKNNTLFHKYKENVQKFYQDNTFLPLKNHIMINGDITEPEVFKTIINKAKEHNSQNGGPIDFLMATPPCQGMSLAGSGRRLEEGDPRNKLIIHAINAILEIKPKYFLIENVPEMLKHSITVNNENIKIIDYIQNKISDLYNFNETNEGIGQVANSADYGTPQSRKRAFILGVRKDVAQANNFTWHIPNEKQDIITVRDAIGKLPSLESSQTSSLKWHKAKKHNEKHIEWMKNTPTGQTAFNNDNKEHTPYTSINIGTKKGAMFNNNILVDLNGQVIKVSATNENDWWVDPCGRPVYLEDDIIELGDKYALKIKERDGKIYFSKHKDAIEVKKTISGYKTTYKRMEWDKPAPTITMGNGSISSQNNVHPGNKLKDGTYDNARVLTLREIMILTGLNPDLWRVPEMNKDIADENTIRHVIGECIPPNLIKSIVQEIFKNT